METTTKESQNKAILRALKRGARLTPIDMLKRFGSLRASARAYDLKQQGHPVQTEMVKLKSGKRVARYYLKTEAI